MAKAKATGKSKSVKKKQKTAATPKNPAKSFNKFEVEEWTRFIRFALHENPSVLNLDPKGEALDAGFIRILNSLSGDPGAKDRFGEALSLVFESTQPSRDNAEAIYTLLQLISYTTPSAAKSIVRR